MFLFQLHYEDLRWLGCRPLLGHRGRQRPVPLPRIRRRCTPQTGRTGRTPTWTLPGWRRRRWLHPISQLPIWRKKLLGLLEVLRPAVECRPGVKAKQFTSPVVLSLYPSHPIRSFIIVYIECHLKCYLDTTGGKSAANHYNDTELKCFNFLIFCFFIPY